MAIHLGIIFILLVLSGFFSATETALFSLSKIEKRRIQENHPKMFPFVKTHLERPRRTLSSILIGNLSVNTLATTIVTLTALQFFSPQVMGAVLFAFTAFLILFSEIIPKILAIQNNITIAVWVALPLRVFSLFIAPVRYVARAVSDGILILLNPDKKAHSDQISEEEIKTLVTMSEEEGILDRQERKMIQKLLELGERPVKHIMTPRIDMVGLDADDSIGKQIEQIKKYHYTHFPVYKETIDNILGFVSTHEYMLNQNKPLSALIKEPLFIPESKRIDDLLAEFRKTNQNFAVCVDEYGGTAGLVTQEDVLEEIFGEFYDEYEKIENPIRSIGHGAFIVEAKISLFDFNEFFSSDLKAEEASTLGGMILEKMGEVPQKGQIIHIENFEIRIHEVIRQRRIRSVVVRPKT